MQPRPPKWRSTLPRQLAAMVERLTAHQTDQRFALALMPREPAIGGAPSTSGAMTHLDQPFRVLVRHVANRPAGTAPCLTVVLSFTFPIRWNRIDVGNALIP